jgi:hypothetical protein
MVTEELTVRLSKLCPAVVLQQDCFPGEVLSSGHADQRD